MVAETESLANDSLRHSFFFLEYLVVVVVVLHTR